MESVCPKIWMHSLHGHICRSLTTILISLANIDITVDKLQSHPGLGNLRQSYVPLPLGDNKINTDLARSFKQGWQHLGFWDHQNCMKFTGMGSNLPKSSGLFVMLYPKEPWLALHQTGMIYDHALIIARNLPLVVVLQNWVQNEIIDWYKGWKPDFEFPDWMHLNLGQGECICHSCHAPKIKLLCKVVFTLTISLNTRLLLTIQVCPFVFGASRGWCNLDRLIVVAKID